MSYKLFCPVPKKQRPINEYMDLVQSDFFNWPTQNESIFIKQILKTFFILFLILLPFSNIFFINNQSFTKIFLVNVGLSCGFIFLIVLRLILAWTYIQRRLYNPSVFYEESGWYYGRIWVKSKPILVQDRFIHTYQVLPILKKLQKILKFISLFFICWVVLIILT
jgi:hypothetical protein